MAKIIDIRLAYLVDKLNEATEMQVRLYRAKAAYRGYPDEFTLYFPYPKWLRLETKKNTGGLIYGYGIGCSEDFHGEVIRCNGFYLDQTRGYSIASLGRRYPLEKMSEQFQKWAKEMERIYNEAIKFDDEEHWEKWNRC